MTSLNNKYGKERIRNNENYVNIEKLVHIEYDIHIKSENTRSNSN